MTKAERIRAKQWEKFMQKTREDFKALLKLLLLVVIAFTAFYLCQQDADCSSEMKVVQLNEEIKVIPPPKMEEIKISPPRFEVVLDDFYETISYDDYFLFCQIAYAEAGADSDDCIVGTMWQIKNVAIEEENGDFQKAIHKESRYEVLHEDGNVYCGEGIVREKLISDEFREKAVKVLSGEIPDPTKKAFTDSKFGAICFLPYGNWCDTPEEFAEKMQIKEYIALGGHIFFREWTKELNDLFS